MRPILLGIVGDSAAGKTTLTKGIAQVLGVDNVTVICTDDYHRYDRRQRKQLGITALHPDANYMDIMQQHLRLLRAGEPILKPIYNHSTGTFDPPEYIKPSPFVIVEGLLGYIHPGCRSCFDVKVYLAPPEPLRHQWKIKRDTLKRGYTPEQVQAELIKREPDSEAFIRPQRQWADLVVSFYPSQPNSDLLNARLVLRPTIDHPDFSQILGRDPQAAVRLTLDRDMGKPVDVLEVDAHATAEQVRALEQAMCAASPHVGAVCNLETNPALGFVIGTTGEPIQSYPLAITQLLISYHMLQATQTIAK
ncbi:MAG: phosphoribulokinase [Thermostichales cyanobacterium GMQP_bins_62]